MTRLCKRIHAISQNLQDTPEEYDVDETIYIWYNGAKVVADVKMCGSFFGISGKSAAVIYVCSWGVIGGRLIT